MFISAARNKALCEFSEKIGVPHLMVGLLNTVFTHPSFVQEKRESYERLEFLGDAVLKLIVSNYFFKKYNRELEGVLTEKRNSVVSDETLAKLAEKLEYEDLILMSDDMKNSSYSKEIVLACVFEALLGAIHLEGGYVRAEKFFLDNFTEEIEEIASTARSSNYKALLQEYTQSIDATLPEYILTEETGKSHDKTFTYEVVWQNNLLGTGSGKTKKQAQTYAAKCAIEKLKDEGAKI